eukprot:1159968-Pelagomonas_calceolata.AAC.5
MESARPRASERGMNKVLCMNQARREPGCLPVCCDCGDADCDDDVALILMPNSSEKHRPIRCTTEGMRQVLGS